MLVGGSGVERIGSGCRSVMGGKAGVQSRGGSLRLGAWMTTFGVVGVGPEAEHRGRERGKSGIAI